MLFQRAFTNQKMPGKSFMPHINWVCGRWVLGVGIRHWHLSNNCLEPGVSMPNISKDSCNLKLNCKKILISHNNINKLSCINILYITDRENIFLQRILIHKRIFFWCLETQKLKNLDPSYISTFYIFRTLKYTKYEFIRWKYRFCSKFL